MTAVSWSNAWQLQVGELPRQHPVLPASWLEAEAPPGSFSANAADIHKVASVRTWQVQSFGTLLMREPWEVRVDMGRWCGHFGTLTPFDRLARTSSGCHCSALHTLRKLERCNIAESHGQNEGHTQWGLCCCLL